ncbi:MAG: serine/threonine protein kinase, partial [Deltaproteobacteria bacterium]|nr:serine/threonine protein kinase [Nannocystaceae bacterium]
MPDEPADEGVDTRMLRELLHGRLFASDTATPVRLGRFVVEQRLGAGAMGVVWAAHDPELDRRVAIKLLKPEADADELAARLRREAQAMARLAHPNVVAVHEVGVHEGAPFVAMELVDGTTLRQWWSDAPRSISEVLTIFAAAGAGLAAAHDAGLVHRDFKPDNVLIGRDRRARVGDFGLVRGVPGATAQVTTFAEGPTEITHSSALAGTPAYMAPEVFEGAQPSAASDQYAFCISLFEALYGTRPHEAPTLYAMIDARRSGRVSFPPRPRIGRAVQRLLARGLDRDPAARFGSMGALLEALEHARHPSRMPWVVGGAVAAAALALAIGRLDRAPSCAEAAAVISGTWDDTRRAAVQAALADDGLPAGYAGAVAERIEQRLDGWVEGWRAVHAETCAAADEGTRAQQLVERQLLCLERRRRELDGLVAAIESSAAAVTGRALQAAVALPSAEQCGELERLLDELAPPEPAIAPQVAEVRAELARAKSILDVEADAAAALRRAQDALADAQALAYPPLIAEAELRVALATIAKGDLPGAEALLERAYFDAIAAGHEVLALQTAASLLHTIGVRGGRPQDALRWWEHGDALLRKRGHSPRDAHQLGNSRAAVLSELGRHAEAQGVARQAVADAEQGYSADHPNTFSALQNLAGAQLGLAQYEEALAIYERVVAGLERLYGEDHPATASAMANTAIALGDLGRHAEALAQHQRALGIFERTVGEHTMEAGYTLANMANIHSRLGDHDAALASALRAKAALSVALSPDHPRTIMLGGNIGHIYLRLGQLELARASLQETIDALTRIDARQPELPNNLDRLGLVELAAGDCARSLGHHQRALEIAVAVGLPPHTQAYQQLNIGIALDCLGRPGEAIAPLEQAAAVWGEAHGEDSQQVDNARRALAGALVGASRPTDALALVAVSLGRCDTSPCDPSARADVLGLQAEPEQRLGRAHDARVAA